MGMQEGERVWMSAKPSFLLYASPVSSVPCPASAKHVHSSQL